MGYFSGPAIRQQWDQTGGFGAAQKSRVMGQARNEAENYATKQALSEGMAQGPQMALGENMALANQAKERRYKMWLEEMNDPQQFIQSSYSGGRHWGLGGGGPVGWNDAMDAFFESIRGKNVNLGGFGRTVDYDVPTGKSYSRDAGEVAPGLRGAVNKQDPNFAYAVTQASGPDFKPTKGGFYTPDELARMDPWQRSRIGYENSLNRVTRGGY